MALHALAWILTNEARANRFLDLTGLTPETLRASLADVVLQRAVIDFLLAHEPDLVAAAEHLDVEPTRLAAAGARLSS